MDSKARISLLLKPTPYWRVLGAIIGHCPVIGGEGQSHVEPEGLVPTGPPETGLKHPKIDDAYKQTKARLEIRLLKAKLGQAGLSTADEADDDDEEEGELIRRTTHDKN
ncbi:unnamed protein product [Pleuronectes platessa]|uniref:Uncharacterized protein n=1 Tax=Pleuronectes platessa TaxID=8262 RepID=A0A9N7V014_PLEPL|nr:unnamed protein product [Pleuronectes platessa]